MSDRPPIIVTKILVPKKHSGLFQRPRLLNFLHSHIERKLILVSAAAGYGKTSLLADFAHGTDLPVCWYSLDATDRDPRVLLEYLVATIRQRFPHFGNKTQTLLQARWPASGNLQPVVTTLVNEIYDTIPEFFVLVLDDFHLLAESRPVEAFFDQLLQYLPDNCHMILASRTIPALPLLRLAAYREVAGLGSDDLRFTGGEIQGLLKQEYNLYLPDAAADELARESEGWITGILLTTQTFWRGMLENLTRAKGPPEQVFQYLATEVFARQPEEIRDFLLASSILRQMNSYLCDSVLESENAGEMLDWIEKRNLFVTRVEGPETWYKYHHLFQEFLQAKLREKDQVRYVRLHLRAAAYFEGLGNPTEAIHHYYQVRAYEDACPRIAAVAEPMFEEGRIETLKGWIDAVPQGVLDAAPQLLVTRARIHIVSGELHLAGQRLKQAEQCFTVSRDRAGEAKALIYQSTVSSLEGGYQNAQNACRRALEILTAVQGDAWNAPEPGPGTSNPPGRRAIQKLMAAAHRNLGVSAWGMGRLEQARDELEKALAIYLDLGDAYHMANVHQELGSCLRALGSLPGAQAHYQKSLALWEQIGNPATLANVMNSTAVVMHQRGEYARALELFQSALQRAREAASWRFQGYILAGMGDVYRDLDDYEKCQQLYSDALELAARVGDGQLTVYCLDALGNTARLRKDPITARSLLHQALEEASGHQSSREQGQCEISLGVLSRETGEVESALEHLERARMLLEGSGARPDLARLHFHLAQTLYSARRRTEALVHLQTGLETGSAAGAEQFMLVEGRRALPFLKYAARRLDDRRLSGLISRIEASMSVDLNRPSIETGIGQDASAQSRLEIRAFGKGAVFKDSVPVTQPEWGAAQARELFFYILAHPDRSKEQIGAVFWPDLSLSRMTSTFHATLYRVRRAVGKDCILYENDRYRFNRGLNYWHDAEEFERLVAETERPGTSADAGAHRLRQALTLCRGDYLEDVYSDWAMPQRDLLLHRFVEAAIRLADHYAGLRDYEQAARLYRQVLHKDNLREEVHRRLMECYVQAGERARALKHYDRLVTLLDRELDASPAPETVALFEEIQRSA